ncbi:Neuropeptide CCHamide-1 receptor [Homalodisca vitripennis]|nr:Neuropeptide CCHamide-1 receptor [Homalodisca vitripennis]
MQNSTRIEPAMDSHRNASGWMHGYENDTELVGYVPYSERPETYIVPVVFAIIFLVGVLGNGTLVFIFARHRTMRNVPNTYIFSLALGDLLVIVSCVPFTSTLYTIESWPWGELICKLSEATKDVSIRVRVHSDRPQCREVLCRRQPHQKSHLLQAAHHHHYYYKCFRLKPKCFVI